VEVDEEEREDDPVPERVDERSELEHVDLARQARVERADVPVETAQRTANNGGLKRAAFAGILT
jgi:hypothetical protein